MVKSKWIALGGVVSLVVVALIKYQLSSIKAADNTEVAPQEKAQAPLTIVGTALDDAIKEKPVAMVVFFRPDCPYCKALQPLLEKLEKSYQGKALVRTINVTESPKMKERFGIQTVPFVTFFQLGELVQTLQGNEEERTEEKLRAHLDHYLAQSQTA